MENNFFCIKPVINVLLEPKKSSKVSSQLIYGEKFQIISRSKNYIKIKKSYSKGDIIFWNGHVAVCLNNRMLIHAYGPRKKVLIMPIKNAINIIQQTANLKVKKIYKI